MCSLWCGHKLAAAWAVHPAVCQGSTGHADSDPDVQVSGSIASAYGGSRFGNSILSCLRVVSEEGKGAVEAQKQVIVINRRLF